MTLVVSLLVLVMMLIVLGYTINQNDGKIEQGSLLQLTSRPSGAEVSIDGTDVGSTTNTKRTVSTGEHTITYALDKYHPWSKSVNLSAGQVVWINYARLVPINLVPATVQTFASVASMSASPNRSYMLLHEKPESSTFQFVDVRTDDVRTTEVTLPDGSLSVPTKGAQKVKVVAWSSNENFVLVRNDFGNQTEWVVIDREHPEKSININKTFAISPDKVVFAGKSDRLFFALIDNSVKRLNTSDKSTSISLATSVDDFSAYDDSTIAYTGLPNELGVRVAGYSQLDFRKQQIIRTYHNTDKPFFVAMSSYFNKRYAAVVRDNQLIVDTGSFATPSSSPDLRRVFAKDIPSGVRKLTISANGRFVLLEYADKFAVYDIELGVYHQTQWTYQTANQKAAQWLDDYIIWSDNGGDLRIYDFDGANQHDLMKVTEGFSAVLAGGGKYVYGLLQTDKGYELRRVQLVL